MKKKIISIIIVTLLIMAFLLSYIISYANNEETIYVNLTKLSTQGVGYGIGDPSPSGGGQYIWNLTTYDSASSTTASATQRNLYCIKANYGSTWNTNKDTIVAYNLSYDLQNDRETLLSKIVDNGNDADDIITALLNSETGYYRELLWILDNAYIAGQTNKTEFLANIGFVYDSADEVYYYDPVEGYDYSSLVSATTNAAGCEFILTDEDIRAVQKAAIWYYTNYETDGDATFNKKDSTDWLSISDDGDTYDRLSTLTHPTTSEGNDRNDQAIVLYNYLIDAAAANASNYTDENNYTLQRPANVDTTGLTQNTDGKYKLSTTRVGSYYVIGPIEIDKNNTSTYGISIEVTDPTITDPDNDDIAYTFTDSTGTALGTTEIKDLVGRTGGFYISVSRAVAKEVNIKISITQETTKKTLWLNGTENKDADTITSIKLNAEQPIVEVTRTEETITTEFEAQPDEFDLALRKYITQLNGTDLTSTRVPNIDLSTLSTGTTATYKHRKDPVVVQDKDEVTYTIAIYNEGNKAGYASKIVDQLPTGLINSPSNSATVVSKDKNDNTKNTYTLEYSTTSNQIILTIVDTTENPAQTLQPYTLGDFDYETIEIKCKVAQEADTKNQIVLTNVAWIDEAYNFDDGITITNQVGKDRDSEPDTSPSVNQGNIQNYKGNTLNPDDLSNSDYFYQGQQDDDDFEKLVIMPVEKIFDLGLKKFIAAVSKDATIEPGEYLTDTGNVDGKYTRAPEITGIYSRDQVGQTVDGVIVTDTVMFNDNDKNAVIVETGDYVLYTIRVYNHGELDGYVSKIKDTLPENLEYVLDSEINADYLWNIEDVEDIHGKTVITTEYYKKGGIAEEAGEDALLTALNPEASISEQNPDYVDVQVLCRVIEPSTSTKVLTNYAQISEETDEDGNIINENEDSLIDIDSTPDEWIDTDDDQDIERVKVRTTGQYDLVLVKEDEDGEQLNSTATFEITTNGVTEVKTVTGKATIAQNVPVDASHLTDDVYVIKETKAPDEYCKFDGTITITVSKNASADGLGYEKTMTYTVTAPDGSDITDETENVDVYVNENGNIYVEVKNYEEPDIHKGVKDVENQDSGYNADEVHTWVIESGIPGNVEDYKFYAITDEIDYRLNFEGNENVTAKIGNTTLVQGTDYKISFVENATGVQDKTTSGRLILTFIDEENSIEASSRIKNNAGKTIQVTFETTFAKDEDGNLLAAMGEQVENQAKLEYQNTSNDEKVEKESEIPEVHTGGVILYKYYVANGEKVSLAGAKFGIYATQTDATNNTNVVMTAISDENGIVKFIGLQYGGDAQDDENNITSNGTYEYDADTASTKYWVAEIEAPEGYKKSDAIIEVTINKDSYNENQIAYEVENTKLNFDLALRKFITEVQGAEVTTRVPQPKIENGKISYEHSKDVVTVHVGDIVVYTIRVYNEGDIAGYAKEIADDIPEYLEYLPEYSTNVDYMWKMYDENGNETENVNEAVKVKTEYLSKENEKDGGENLLNAFNGTTLSCKDVKIAFKVKDPNSNTYEIINHAQISEDKDEYGNDVKDIDSEPDKWNEGEDDQDIEKVKVEYFDLSLLKFVSKVIVVDGGKESITETGYNGHEDPEPVVKVELHKKKVNEVVVKFGYGITITNEGDIPGYATEITDYVPEGLKFESADNPNWTDEGNNVISTKQLENTLLQPGESATIEVILTWINGPDNLALKTNTAEISEDSNEYDVPDRDSIPDNKKDGEDDIDVAKVILSITTGAVKTYFTLTLGLLTIILVGVVLIKKFVI